jgi:hypothetical protein
VDTLRGLGTALVCALTGAIASASLAGCSYATNVASGGACQRTVQCAPGLVCSQGHCTNDLSMFGMGHPTNLDGGVVDGGAVDMGVTMYDTNLPDTAVPPVDAFSPPVDTGTPPVDAFTPPVDAFVPPVDAFTPPPVDANLPDAWVDPNDAA